MPSHKNLIGENLHGSRIVLIHGNPNTIHHPSTYSGETVIDIDTASFYVSTVTGNSSTGYIVTWSTLTSGAPSMSVLTDVDLNGLTDNNILRYNSGTGKWEVSTDVAALSGLTDVDVSGIVDGGIIRYNSSTGKYLASMEMDVHTHLNKANIDTINQNMASTDSPSFNKITLNNLKVGTSTGFVKATSGNIYVDGIDHNNDLATLQGGSSSERYHMTSAEHVLATQLASDSQTGLLTSTGYTEFNNKRNNVDNSGVYTTPTITDNGDGSVTIGTGVYNLYHTLDFSGQIYQHTIVGDTFVLADNITTYILANWNSGSPIIEATTVTPLPYSTLSPVYTLYRDGDEIYQLSWGGTGKGYINKIAYQNLKVDRFQVEPDELNLSTSTGNTITMESGTVWRGGVSVEVPAFNSSVDTVDYYYHVGGVWTKTNAMPSTSTGQYVTKWYDDGTDLVELSADDHCAVNWVYRAVNSNENCVVVVLGRRNYTLSRTQISQPIQELPDFINDFCVLVGRIIVRKDNSLTPIIDNVNKPLYLSESFVENVDAINVEMAERNSTGLISGGVLSYNSGNSFAISAGSAFLSNKITETNTKITWDTYSDIRSVNGNGINYFAVGADGIYTVQATVPDTNLYVYVGACFMSFNNTVLVGLVVNPTRVDDYQKRVDDFVTGPIRTLIESGLKVSEGVTPLTLSISAGYISTRLTRIQFPTPLTSFTKLFYTTNYGWLPNPYFPNIVDVFYWNDMTQAYPGGLTLMTPGYWKKDAIFAMPNGQVYYVYGEAEYATQALALASNLPSIPATTGPAIMILAFICCQRGDISIQSRIADLRPYLQRVFGYEGKGTGDSIMHSSLLALDQDDHSGIYYNKTDADLKYAELGGKSGGQTLNGSKDTGETLRLRNNDVDKLGFDLNADGTLTVANTVDYETLVTTDDTVPNKKYVDDLSAALIQKATDIDSTGLVSGGEIVLTGGITFTVKTGTGYINWNGILTRVTWPDITDLETVINGENFVCMGTNPAGEGQIYISTIQNPSGQYIELGYVFSGAANTAIVELIATPKYTAQLAERVNTYTIEGLRAIVEDGTTVSEQASPNELKLSIASGIIHVNLEQITLDPTTTFTKMYNTANYGFVPLTSSTGYVDTTHWNDTSKNYGAALIEMTPGYFKKDLIFRVPNGHVYYILGQTEYATIEEARAAVLPTVPSNFSRVLVYLCAIAIEKNASTIGAEIIDIRPYLPRIFGFGSSASGVTLDHSSLANLDYASSGHSGFEPSFNHGDFNVGSNKLSISGTSTGAVIGTGLTIDVVETNIDHNNLGSLNSGSYYHADQSMLTTDTPEFADVLITGLGIDSILNNTEDSVEDYITKAWGYNKTLLTDTAIPTGFLNRTDSTILFDLPTLTFKIYGTFSIYLKGLKVNKIIDIGTPDEATLPTNTSGYYRFYYNYTSTGVIQCTAADTDYDPTLGLSIASVYYNKTAGEAIVLDNRQGVNMNSGSRRMFYYGLGTIVKGTGFDLNGTYSVATGNGGLIANSYGITEGHIVEEDKDFTITDLTDTGGVGNIYPIFYRSGTTEWAWILKNLPYYWGTDIAYNKNTGGTFSLEEITTDNTYVNYYLCAINAAPVNSEYRFVWVMGQSSYASLELAQQKTFLDLDLTHLPFHTVAPLHQITMRRNAGYTAPTGYARIEAIVNIIGTFASIAATFNVQKHNTLAGRTNNNTHPADSISYDNTSTGLVATNVKVAIDEIIKTELPKYQAVSAMGNYQATSAMGNYQATSAMGNYVATSNIGNYQLTANMSNYLGTGATSNFQQTSAMGNYQLTANASLSLGTGASASFMQTANASLYQVVANSTLSLGTGASASFIQTANASLYQVVANSTLSLGTGAAASFVYTANSSLFQHTSAMGNYQLTANNSLSLGTGAAASFMQTANASLYQVVANSTLSLGTGAAASFMQTANASLYQVVANSTNSLGTGASASFMQTANASLYQLVANSSNSLGTGATASFQYTSAMGNYQATSLMANYFLTANSSNLMATGERANYFLTANSTNLMNTTERANYYDTAGHTLAESTHIHGAFTGINISATSASNGLQLSVANPGGVVNMSHYEPYPMYLNSATSSFTQGSAYFVTFNLPAYVAISEINVIKSFNIAPYAVTSAASTVSHGYSYSQGATLFKRSDYGVNSSVLSYVLSGLGGISFSNGISRVTSSNVLRVSYITNSTGGTTSWSTVSASNAYSSYWTGLKYLPIPFVTTLSPGEYWPSLSTYKCFCYIRNKYNISFYEPITNVYT